MKGEYKTLTYATGSDVNGHPLVTAHRSLLTQESGSLWFKAENKWAGGPAPQPIPYSRDQAVAMRDALNEALEDWPERK